MFNRAFPFAAACLVAVYPILAQTNPVLPPAFATTDGGTGNYIPLGASTGGTYLVLYGADQLAALPLGSTITAMQLRLRNAENASWPPSNISITQYDVRFATSALTPSTISTTFASNLSSPVLVRSGPMNIAANAYPAAATGTAPEAWGPVIPFSTSYIYTGGPLAIEFRSSGSSVETRYANAVVDNSSYASVGTISSPGATTGFTGSSSVIVRLTVTSPTTPFQTGVTKVITLGDVTNARAGNSNTSFLNISPRTIQTAIEQGELRGLGPTSSFVGLGFRGANTAAWPAAAQSFTKYDIQLSKSNNAPATLSDTIASNTGADAVNVRAGALPVSVGSLFPWPASGLRPAPWNFEIPFTTPYSYTGGHLLSVIRSDGVTGPLSGEIDAIPTANPLYGTRVRARLSAASSVAASTTSAVAYPAERWSVNAGTVAPLAKATSGGGTFGVAQIQNADITYQLIIAQSQLTHIPLGAQITSFSLRSPGAASPSSNIFTSDLRVEISTSRRTPSAASTTYANNEGADKLLVREGPLFIGANSMPANPGFGTPIYFSRAFVYKGGDLCITVRFNAFNGNVSVDQVAASADSIQIASFGKNSTIGSVFSPPVVRIGYTPSVSVPVAIAATRGNNGYATLFGPGNVHQGIYAASELTGLRIGSIITGVSFRLYSFATWPETDTTINRFDVTLSSSPKTPQTMSNTFAENIGADAVLVRSGSLIIPAGAFPFTGSSPANDNRWFIQFTEPFVYKGGPLSMTIRNDANLLNAFYWDVIEGSGTALGRLSYAAGADAATQNSSLFGALAARFAFVPAGFCPSDLNNDGFVDDADFSVFVLAYNTLDCNDPSMPFGCPSDLNFDHIVDDADFSNFLGAYNNFLCP